MFAQREIEGMTGFADRLLRLFGTGAAGAASEDLSIFRKRLDANGSKPTLYGSSAALYLINRRRQAKAIRDRIKALREAYEQRDEAIPPLLVSLGFREYDQHGLFLERFGRIEIRELVGRPCLFRNEIHWDGESLDELCAQLKDDNPLLDGIGKRPLQDPQPVCLALRFNDASFEDHAGALQFAETCADWVLKTWPACGRGWPAVVFLCIEDNEHVRIDNEPSLAVDRRKKRNEERRKLLTGFADTHASSPRYLHLEDFPLVAGKDLDEWLSDIGNFVDHQLRETLRAKRSEIFTMAGQKHPMTDVHRHLHLCFSEQHNPFARA